MTALLGLLAAVAYGLGDFVGGLGSRRASAMTLLLYSYPVGAVLMAALLPLFPGHVDARVVIFGALGGLAGLLGVAVMYSLMVVAPMNVVSPVTAVLAAAVPVAVGVTVGDRPAAAAWAGIVIGMLAVFLVSRTSDGHPHGRVSARVLAGALVAGVGFGLYFVFLARAGGHAGLWPLVVSRLVSAATIVPVALAAGTARRIDRPTTGLAVTAGVLDASANMFFLLATHAGLLSLAAVLTSLYPAVTVLLAVGVLRERTTMVQRAGLALAAASIVLITV